MSSAIRSKRELEKAREYYDNIYYRDVKASPGASRHFQSLASKLNVAPGQRVLDVACGTGEWLLALNECGAIPVGIDLSSKALGACRQSMPEGGFFLSPAERLPFPDSHFDFVSCLGSLEHFVDPLRALEEMRRVATDEANFLFLVPNAGFLTRRLGLFTGTDQVALREEVRALAEWQELFESASFRVENRWHDLHVVSWTWIRNAALPLIPLRALQALALIFWPLRWQYQVYFLCHKCEPPFRR